MNKNQSGFGMSAILILLVVFGLLGAAGWFVYDRQNKANEDLETANSQAQTNQQSNEAEPEEATPEATKPSGPVFGATGEYGTARVTGYATTTQVDEAWCETDTCKKYTYVSFKITNTDNQKLKDFMAAYAGNSFIGDSAVGIGCVESGVISYENASDAFPNGSYTLSKEVSDKILASTVSSPIQLDIEKLEYTSGRGASTCTSLFTYFRLV